MGAGHNAVNFHASTGAGGDGSGGGARGNSSSVLALEPSELAFFNAGQGAHNPRAAGGVTLALPGGGKSRPGSPDADQLPAALSRPTPPGRRALAAAGDANMGSFSGALAPLGGAGGTARAAASALGAVGGGGAGAEGGAGGRRRSTEQAEQQTPPGKRGAGRSQLGTSPGPVAESTVHRGMHASPPSAPAPPPPSPPPAAAALAPAVASPPTALPTPGSAQKPPLPPSPLATPQKLSQAQVTLSQSQSQQPPLTWLQASPQRASPSPSRLGTSPPGSQALRSQASLDRERGASGSANGSACSSEGGASAQDATPSAAAVLAALAGDGALCVGFNSVETEGAVQP